MSKSITRAASTLTIASCRKFTSAWMPVKRLSWSSRGKLSALKQWRPIGRYSSRRRRSSTLRILSRTSCSSKIRTTASLLTIILRSTCQSGVRHLSTRPCAASLVARNAADSSFTTMRRMVYSISSCFVMTVVATLPASCGNCIRRLALRLRRKTRGARGGLLSLRHPRARILYNSMMTAQLVHRRFKWAQMLQCLQGERWTQVCRLRTWQSTKVTTNSISKPLRQVYLALRLVLSHIKTRPMLYQPWPRWILLWARLSSPLS